MGSMSSAGGGGGPVRVDEVNTWTEVQVFQQGIQVLDGTAIGTSDGSAFDIGRTNESVRVRGELDVFSGLTQIRGRFYHSGLQVGFYGTAPIDKQTGVAVNLAAVHAALVALGLFE